jgi:hypothetical protein
LDYINKGVKLEKAYQRFEERQKQRTIFVSILIVFLVIMFAFQAYIAFTAMPLYFYFALIWFAGFIVLSFYGTRQPWGSEVLETQIFANLYNASKQLELYSGEDEKAQLCLKKAAKNVENALFYLTRLEKQLKDVNSTFVKGNLVEPIDKLRTNIRERILPRINNPKETPHMLSVVRGLADMFGQTQRILKIENIDAKNEVLETFAKVETKEEPKRLELFLSKKSVRAVLSLFLSAFIVSAFTLVHSFASSTNFWVSLNSTTNFLTFFGTIIALGAVIYSVVKKG